MDKCSVQKKYSLNLHTHTVLHKHVYEFQELFAKRLENKILNTFY